MQHFSRAHDFSPPYFPLRQRTELLRYHNITFAYNNAKFFNNMIYYHDATMIRIS